MSSSANDKPPKEPKVKGQGSAAGAMAKGILIMVLLVIGAGAGGYFFGTFQKFAPVENVPPGTPGAIGSSSPSSSSSTPSGVNGLSPNGLKKKYWLASQGWDHVGYAITVFINNQQVDKFFANGREVDVTKFCKPGENTITFDAQVLPNGMREHAGDASYSFSVALYSSNVVGQTSGRDELLKYTRNAAEFDNKKDTMQFLTVE